jgi:hypothetical protein
MCKINRLSICDEPLHVCVCIYRQSCASQRRAQTSKHPLHPKSLYFTKKFVVSKALISNLSGAYFKLCLYVRTVCCSRSRAGEFGITMQMCSVKVSWNVWNNLFIYIWLNVLKSLENINKIFIST